MENSIKVTGELNRVAREVFLTFLPPDEPNLWSFQFLKGNDVMLEVADFSEGWLYLEEREVKDLLAQGVDGSSEGFSMGNQNFGASGAMGLTLISPM